MSFQLVILEILCSPGKKWEDITLCKKRQESLRKLGLIQIANMKSCHSTVAVDFFGSLAHDGKVW